MREREIGKQNNIMYYASFAFSTTMSFTVHIAYKPDQHIVLHSLKWERHGVQLDPSSETERELTLSQIVLYINMTHPILAYVTVVKLKSYW